MARNLKQINNAENHLIVGSIEVLGDISNSGMKQIKRNVRSLQDSMTAYVGQTTDYWSKLSDDGIITPLEKTMLKKEWETIAQTYTTVMAEAVAQQVTTSREIIAYQAAYNDLRYYLNTTLALFDEMSMDTAISDREEFNEYFATYYQWENLVQVALAVGKIGSLDFIVVDNLDFQGTDDQVVIYKGELYQWIHGQWKKIGTNGYMGALASFPTEMEGNFFLCTQSFTANVYLKTPEGYNLLSPNDEVICIPQLIEASYIYAFESGHWNKIADTTDYRYIVAMSDYYNLTGELPAIWQNSLDEIDESLTDILERLGFTEDDISALLGTMTAAELHALIEQYGDDLTSLQAELNKKLEHIPQYLGLISVVSNIPTADKEHLGDWFLWNSNTTSMSGLLLYKGYVYKCTKASGFDVYSWQSLNPADTTNSSYYMSCLSDLLQQTDVIGSGTFNTLFANAFFANSASITALKTKTIELSGDDGLIKSEDYIAGGDTKGFLLKSDGTFECVDGTFNGTLSGATGEFNGYLKRSGIGERIIGFVSFVNTSAIDTDYITRMAGYQADSTIVTAYSENISYVKRLEKGVFDVQFTPGSMNDVENICIETVSMFYYDPSVSSTKLKSRPYNRSLMSNLGWYGDTAYGGHCVPLTKGNFYDGDGFILFDTDWQGNVINSGLITCKVVGDSISFLCTNRGHTIVDPAACFLIFKESKNYHEQQTPIVTPHA